MKHTEGPWTVSKRRGSYVHINAFEWVALARVVVRMELSSEDNSEGLANARLIAAAPELLKVLEATYLRLQILSNRNVNFAIDTDRIRATLRNAVSQATGEDAKTVQENCESSAIAKAEL